MTANDFVTWLRGFIQASSNFTLTPKQFDDLKEQLDKVVDNQRATRYTLDSENWNVNTTAHINDSEAYKINQNDKR